MVPERIWKENDFNLSDLMDNLFKLYVEHYIKQKLVDIWSQITYNTTILKSMNKKINYNKLFQRASVWCKSSNN